MGHLAPVDDAPLPSGRPGIQGRRAGFVTRALANSLDFGVVVLVLTSGYVAVVAGRFLLHPRGFQFPSPVFQVVLLLGAAVQFAYFTLAWMLAGRTYGDEVLGLRVVSARGERLEWAGAALRALLCVLFPIGLLWVLVSGQNRSVQDVVLHTSVVYDWFDRS
jgi:uncharacterized RDD family membrane protein YckC